MSHGSYNTTNLKKHECIADNNPDIFDSFLQFVYEWTVNIYDPNATKYVFNNYVSLMHCKQFIIPAHATSNNYPS